VEADPCKVELLETVLVEMRRLNDHHLAWQRTLIPVCDC
jgi:hypothetical protein